MLFHLRPQLRALRASLPAGIARRMGDGWAAAQASEYARSGFVGPDLGPWLDWYRGRRDDAPSPSYDSRLAAKGET